MKKYITLCCALLLAIILVACGGTEDEDKETTSSESNQTDKTELEEERQAKVGDTIKNEGGEFTLTNRIDEVDSIESGPVNLEIEQILSSSGKLKGEMAGFVGQDEIEFIQVDLSVKNTSDEDITFYAGQAVLVTDTGEQLEADMWLSDHIDGDLLSGVKADGSFMYILEKSTADEVSSVRLKWSAPLDDNYENIGEEINVKYEF